MRRGELTFNFLVFLGPLLVCLGFAAASVFVMSWPVAAKASWVMSVLISLTSLIYAKMPNFKRREFSGFGLSNIEASRKKYYILAFLGLAICTLLSIAIVAGSK